MRSMGRITILQNTIGIECQPHVAIKLQRMFPGLKRIGAGQFSLKATPEAAYDLAWFSTRYRLDVDDEALAQFDRLRATHARKLDAISEVLTMGEDYKPPEFALKLPPREYQKIAADLAVRSGALLIADDLGLGKTCSAICVLTAEGKLPALVVTMTHLRRQWKEQLAKFAPKLRTQIVTSMQAHDLSEVVVEKGPNGKRRVVRGPSMPDVLITAYHLLPGWCDTLAGRVKTVVYDEVQELRHNETKKYEAAKAITSGASQTVSLSATPIYNYGAEIHNVIEVTAPDSLGDRKEFLQEWCTAYSEERKAKVKDPVALGTYLRESGLMIRRTRKDVGRELPPLTIVRHEVDADESKLSALSDDIAELARRVLSRSGERIDRLRNAGELDWRLRQATGIAKAPAVAEFVRLLLDSEERVVLYGWHHEVYSIWENIFARHEIATVRYTGKENDKQKADARQAFIDGKARVLIMSLRAGAGLDGLQACCRTLVFGELDWSPMVHAQDIGRLDRDGQPDPVTAYYLVTNHGSDPVIIDVLGVKEAQSEGIRNLVAGDKAEPLAGADENHIRRLAEEFLRRRAGVS